jgi:GntR family transcriptional regulator
LLHTISPGSRGGRGLERSRTIRWVCDLLRTELATGAYPDRVLPTEDALITKYGVSRGVIRKVLLILQEQGAIERVRGVGTFVLTPSVLTHGIDESRDIAQEVNAAATRIAIRKAHASLHPANPYVAGMLELEVGADVIIVESLTSLDGSPLSLRSAFMPAERFGILVEDPTFDLNRSPYDIIEEVLQEPVGETDLQISSSTADKISAEHLNVPVGFALLDTTRTIRTLGRDPVEYSISHARSDRVVFSTLMPAQPAGPRPRTREREIF